MSDYQKILSFLKKQSLIHFIKEFLDLAFLSAGILFTVSSVLFILFQIFPWTGIITVFDTFILAVSAVFIYLTIKKIVKFPSPFATAVFLEKDCGYSHSTLSLAVQLKQKPVGGESIDLINQTVSQTSRVLDNYILKKKYPGLKALLFCILSGALFFLAAINTRPSLISYWNLPFMFNERSAGIVKPGSLEIAQGETVKLTWQPLNNKLPSTVLKIEYLPGNKNLKRLLRPDTNGIFSFTVDSAQNSFRYLFSSGNSIGKFDTITVVSPPGLYSLKVSLTPPRYTGRPQRKLSEGRGNITCYPGTKANFYIESHYPLLNSSLILSDTDTLQMEVKNSSAEIETALWKSCGYSFLMQDTLLQHNISIPSYIIKTIPDYDPVVNFIRPGYNVDLKPSQQETLLVEGVDDLGIKRLTLKWWKNTGDSVYSKNLLDESGGFPKTVQNEMVWDLTELSLYPGDTAYYCAVIEDTWPYKNPHTVESDTFWFRIPSFTEIHKKMAEKEKQSEDIFKNVKKSQNSLQKRLEDFIKSSKGKDKLSWEEKKIVQDMQKNINRQIDSLRDAVSSLKKAMEHIQDKKSIKNKMDQIQKAVDEIIKEYGENALFDKQEKADELSWEDIKNNIDKMNKVLPKIEDYLENTLKYLEMLKQDQELASLASQAEELSRKQLEAVETENPDLLKNREDRLLSEIGSLLDNISKISKDPDNQLSDFPDAKEAANIKNSLHSSLSQNKSPEISDMIRMSSSLSSLSQKLNSMMSSSMMKRLAEDKNRLNRMADYTLKTADWQKTIEKSVLNKNRGEISAASQQAILDALKDSKNNLDSIAMLPPSIMQQILEDLQSAVHSVENILEDFNKPYARNQMNRAESDIMNLTLSLLAAADSLGQAGSNSGAGGGLMPGIQKLSGKQAAVNSITSSLFKNMLDEEGQSGGQKGKGSGSSPGIQEEARRAQQEIADQLKNLAEKYRNPENQSTLDNVKKLEEEAERLARMIENNNPDVKKQQDRFLVRMLQTTLSVHDQDRKKKNRVSRSAKKVFYKATNIPDTGLDLLREDTFYKLRRKAMDGNYPEEYRFGVQNYFDSLGVLFLTD